MKEKVIFSWSGGKDSALALYELKETGKYDIAALLTTVTKDYDRVSMHGVRAALLEAQAVSLGIKLEKALMTKSATIEENESKIGEIVLRDNRYYFCDLLPANAAVAAQETVDF